MAQLEAREVPLHKVFCSDYDFRIPDYQRPYAWEIEQAEQLLADLEEALLRGNGEPYFLGSLVLVKGRAAEADVIDGQQRLTTLTILLAVLRDLAQQPDVVTNLVAMIAEPGNTVLGLKAKPRLTLRPRDADFFHQHIQTLGSIEKLLELNPHNLKTDAQRALQANARVLHTALTTWSDDQRLALCTLMGVQTFLVAVSTPDLDSAHRIFSVMNSRGLDLSPADIFKAQVIGEIDEEASETYATRWEDAEETLGRDDFSDLFLHIRMIFSGERARQELLKEFQTQVLVHYKQGRAREFVDEVLVPYAEAFAVIRDKTYSAGEGSDQVNLWFRRLLQLDNSDWWPAALWALRHHGDDPMWLGSFFRSLERLAASMFIRRVYTTPRVQRFAELLKELTAGGGLEAPSLQLTEAERAETLARLDGDVYHETKTRRYILLRLDELVAEEDVVATYDAPRITVEHVLPQNPSIPSQWRADFTADERVRWTHRLANLVLLSRTKNSQVQNLDFTVKKERYLRRGVVTFPLTTQVLGQDTWTPEHLKKRQSELLGLLTTEWRL
ncbi:DUF262 domain-containing protein [Streptomyces sp. NBC_01637]|uniref:DUF262 domain-containing protein n=1 Tax=unclassified Streptomyces TaxID=2593676 RepID=UPI0038635DDA|nr:DUF262 domain-containing HNH endonuclease family protein [Streptomyces sp. NBC_01653]WTD92409.1 DUF262 domain-containing HNH endonuclease family protein [Streptomyces sp. NBC_01637]